MRLARLTPAMRTVAAATLLVLVIAGAVRTIAAAFDPFSPYPGHRGDNGIERSRAIRAALAGIATRPEQGVLILGSSGLGRAFIPRVFDDALDHGRGRYVSYNLAQLLLQPETALATAKAIRREYEAVHKRAGIVVFGISVPELTRGSVQAARRGLPQQAFVFSSADVLRDRVRADPLGVVGDGLELLLFGNIRPAQVGRWVEDWTSASSPACESGMQQPPVGEEAAATLGAFCRELRAQFPRGVPAWDAKARGGFDFGLPSTRPMLTRLVELQASSAASASAHVAGAQGSALKDPNDVDEQAVRTMIAAVRELSAVSRHTFVLRDIMNPALLEPLPAAELVHWRSVAGRIAHEADVPLLDLNDGSFVASDFGDKTHLSPLAAERFSSLLAARVGPMVEQDRASR
jgi:hypothetical protein